MTRTLLRRTRWHANCRIQPPVKSVRSLPVWFRLGGQRPVCPTLFAAGASLTTLGIRRIVQVTRSGPTSNHVAEELRPS